MYKRLNRAIASKGVCSRRKADEYILAGRIKINGIPQVNPAVYVSDQDQIELDGILLVSNPPLSYQIMNKPPRIICSASDPQKRQTVLDLLDPGQRSLRIYPVGRLDYFSEGLILLTNDGELANRLMHPRYGLAKIYEVTIRGNVPEEKIRIMASGMTLIDGPKLLPVTIEVNSLPHGDSILTMELRQGVNRQIRRMCAQLDLIILRLKRIAEGGLKLGDLALGKTRELTKKEVDSLYQETRLKHKN